MVKLGSIGLLAGLIVGPCFGGEPAEVDVRRTSIYHIDTGTSTFDGADGLYEIRWDFAAELDDFKQGLDLDIPPNDLLIRTRRTARNFFAGGMGDVEVSNFAFDPTIFQHGALSVDWRLDADDKFDLTVAGTLSAGYSFDSVAGLSGGNTTESFLFARIENDHHVMRFFGGGEGLIETGSGFAVDITLDGRWDPHATGTGSIDYLGIDGSFDIVEFFTYDAAADTTRFIATTDSYLRSPRLRFDLIGAAVPAPSSTAVAGCIMILVSRRRRPR